MNDDQTFSGCEFRWSVVCLIVRADVSVVKACFKVGVGDVIKLM